MYIYILSEDFREDGVRHRLYTVGFYKPDGKFEPESDHSDKDEAAARVSFLNGAPSGGDPIGLRVSRIEAYINRKFPEDPL